MDKIYKVSTIAEEGWDFAAETIPTEYYYSEKIIAINVFNALINEAKSNKEYTILKETENELIYEPTSSNKWHYYIRYEEVLINLDKNFPLF